VGMGVIDPGVHFFGEFTKFGVDDGAVCSFDVLAAGEENGLLFDFGDGYFALFETSKAYLVEVRRGVIVLSVSKKGLESRRGGG